MSESKSKPHRLQWPKDLDSLRVMIAVPSIDGKVYGNTMSCIVRATLDLLERGYRSPMIYQLWQESVIPHARNVMLAEFLASDCTDLVMIDADMTWQPEAFMRILLHPVDMVGAAYRKKVAAVAYNIQWHVDEEDRIVQDKATGLLEVEGLPMGFMRINRRAAERLIREYKPRRYRYARGDKDLTVYKLFDLDWEDGPQGPDGDDGNYWGEDFTFCRRYRSIGGKVWCDPFAVVHHVGNYTYEGNLAAWLQTLKEREPIKPPAEAAA